MSHKNHLYVFTVILTMLGLIFNSGIVRVSASHSKLSASGTSTALALTMSPTAATSTLTPTPGLQAEAGPQAWLDGAIDSEQFGPLDALTIHFNTPMSPESSPQPVLSWPDMEGVSSWDRTQTILTFQPASALDSQKIYTFFLDSALRSVDGKALKDPAEWIVRVQRGPKVQSVSPQPGSLDRRYPVIEVRFDRKMKSVTSDGLVSIEPRVDFELKWKSDRVLQIVLRQPLESDQRYDLTLSGGNDENTLFASDGTYLAEEYRWFYWQEPFEAKAEMLGATTLAIKFNYALDQNKSGKAFSVIPHLDGEWKWSSSQEIRFTAKEPIPASQEFTLNLVHPLVDTNGFETSSIPNISFTGVPPIRLANPNIVKSEYGDYLIADLDVDALRVEFGSPVDHASAETAFSVTPALPGKFHWEQANNSSKETLIYSLNQLFQPGSLYSLKVDSTLLDPRGNRRAPMLKYQR